MLPQEAEFVTECVKRAINVQMVAAIVLGASLVAGIFLGFPSELANGFAAFCFFLAASHVVRAYLKALVAPDGGLLFLTIWLSMGGAISLLYLALDLPVHWSIAAMSAVSIPAMYLVLHEVRTEKIIGNEPEDENAS